MGRRVSRLTLDDLDDLADLGEVTPGCGSCLFWEHTPVGRRERCGHEHEEKLVWVSALLREWGSCGRVLRLDDELVGYLLYAPPAFVPGAEGFATAPIGADAVQLVTGWVHPGRRGQGLGRVLVQAMAKDLLQRGGIRAAEAFGDTRGQGGACVLPAEFLLAVGFATHRAHPRHPRLRMDLRTTVTWRTDLEAALDRLLTPTPTPQPSWREAGGRVPSAPAVNRGYGRLSSPT